MIPAARPNVLQELVDYVLDIVRWGSSLFSFFIIFVHNSSGALSCLHSAKESGVLRTTM